MNALVQEEISHTESWDGVESHEVDIEAKNRLAQIIEDIQSRFEGEKMTNIINYELQEISAGRLAPEKAQVIEVNDFRTVLYSNNLTRKEIAIIVWGIILRARKVLDASQKKAREAKLAARR